MASRTLQVVITGDSASVRKAFGDTESGATSMSSKLDVVAEKMRSVGTKMTIGITAPLALLGKQAFDAGSSLNESMSKVRVVFDDMAPAVIKWSKASAEAMGISQQAALEAAGTFGNLFQALGIMQGPATEMSMKLVGLASDLASFNNASPDDVLLALRSGLVGEAEPLRKFGVSLSAARIEAEALAMGLAKPVAEAAKVTTASIAVEKASIAAAKAMKQHGADSLAARDAQAALAKAEETLSGATAGNVTELTAAQKAQAAYSVIMKDTAMAQGDFSRTASGAANQQRILAAQLENTKAKLGQALIPIVQSATGVIQKLVGWFSSLSPGVQKAVVVFGLVAASLGPVIGLVGSLITVVKGLSTAFMFLTTTPLGMTILGIAAVAAAVILLITHFDDVKRIVSAVAGVVVDAFNTVVGWFKDNWQNILGTLLLGPFWLFRDEIGGFIGDIAGLGADLARSIANGFKSAWNAVADVINDVIPNSIGFDGPFGIGFHVNLPNNPIPRLHSGGEFRAPTPGGEGLALLRDRERVVTPEQDAAGGGRTLVVQLVVDGKMLAEVVRPHALRDQQSGRAWAV